ncbi:hypothetical protein CHELA20_11279 [Hyphomicrobiales bacterium]|nr:hypothetical protein CHELA20_11279 [Hyphomicrobiales bacterium]CAH1695523.1 hypothetical protein CHELA41_51527 [Hyphomicrobiales bacterium]
MPRANQRSSFRPMIRTGSGAWLKKKCSDGGYQPTIRDDGGLTTPKAVCQNLKPQGAGRRVGADPRNGGMRSPGGLRGYSGRRPHGID